MDWDKRLCYDLLEEMKKYDLFVTYYGSVFDFGYIRAKMLYHNIKFFQPKKKYQLDLYYAIRGKIALSRKSLANVTRFLGIEGKTSLSSGWAEICHGYYTKENIESLYVHNTEDVKILEELHKEFEPLVLFLLQQVYSSNLSKP